MREFYDHNRYRLLFYTLLMALALPPLMAAVGVRWRLIEELLALSLIAAVAAHGTGRARRLALGVVILAVAARPATAWLEQHALSMATLATWGVLALLAAGSALRYSLRGREVGPEQVHAALSTYLLAGFFFGLLYWVIEQFVPGSLTVGGAVAAEGMPTATAVYFSFVTLASLGYGDVLPVSELARGLAVVEVVGGQLYLAVMVARLVSAWR